MIYTEKSDYKKHILVLNFEFEEKIFLKHIAHAELFM